MDKSKLEVRLGNLFPNWRLTSTRIEIYGTEGLMLLEIMGGGWQVFDEDGKIRDEQHGYFPDENHLKNFIDCLRTGKTPNGDIIQGHKSASLLHLANLAYRCGNEQLLYDNTKGIITNSDKANQIDKGHYRMPYTIPDVI
jgi:hypothetical protein